VCLGTNDNKELVPCIPKTKVSSSFKPGVLSVLR